MLELRFRAILTIAASMIFMGSLVQSGSQAFANETDASGRFGAFTDNAHLYVSEDGLESWMVGSARKGPLLPENKSEIFVIARMGMFNSEIDVYHFERRLDDPAGQITGYIYSGEDRRTKAPKYSLVNPPIFDGDRGFILKLPSKTLSFLLSADKKELIVLEKGKTVSREIVARVHEPDGASRKKWGVLANLAGNTYQVGESFHFYDWSSRGTLVRRIYSAKLYNDPKLISICEFSYDSKSDDFSCPVGSAPGQSRSSFKIVSHDSFLTNNEVKPLRLFAMPEYGLRSFYQDQATSYESSFANINRLQVLVDFQAKRDLFLAERAGDARVARRQEERQSEAIWANAFRAMRNTQQISPGADLLRPTPLPLASASRGGGGDMGGISRTEAPRMTPQQQAQFDELERIKMREQIARGERPTTIAEDAQARLAGQNSRTGQGGESPGAGSSGARAASRTQVDGRKPSEKAEQRMTYVVCTGSQRATVFRSGKDQAGNREVLRFMFVHYISRIGKISAEPGYGDALNRLSSEFRNQLPSIEAPDRYVS